MGQKRRLQSAVGSRKVDDAEGPPPVGSSASDVARAKLLQQRLADPGPRNLGAEGTVDSYQIIPDPRVQGIQRGLINRWHQDFIQGQAEGQAGKNQEGLLGSGPRKTIKCVDNPLRFRSVMTGSIRKTQTQRLIEGGNVSQALARAKASRFRTRPGSLRDARKVDFDEEFMSTQVGLLSTAKDNFKTVKKNRRLDAVGV